MDSKHLTIIVPTHNRALLLERCLNSIRYIYKDLPIIIGDNSDITYNYNYDIAKKYKCQYLDLRKHTGSIAYTYINLLNNVNTEYILNVEDDDYLINKNFHFKIYNSYIIKNKCDIILYNYIYNNLKLFQKYNCINKSLEDIPSIWNGKFKFDSGYFKTNILKTSIDKIINFDINYFLDVSLDEVVVLLALYYSNKYIFLNNAGLVATCDFKTESFSNPLFYIYSSRKYIDDIGNILNMNKSWLKKYKDILIKMLQYNTTNLTQADVFNNIYLCFLSKITALMLKMHINFKIIKKFLYKALLLKYSKHIKNSLINDKSYLK